MNIIFEKNIRSIKLLIFTINQGFFASDTCRKKLLKQKTDIIFSSTFLLLFALYFLLYIFYFRAKSRQSATRLSLQSSELAPPVPSTASDCCPRWF
jgi:hypothetical protein